MTENEFWELIRQAHQSTRNVINVPMWLVERLGEMPVEDIYDFARQFRNACSRAYDWRLWAAAATICGYCSNDGYADFSAWLIAQGRDVFERAVNDPDSLADIKDYRGNNGDGCLSTLASVAFDAYETKTERRDFWEHFPDLPAYELKHRDSWDGKPESLKQIVPRLAAKFENRT